MTLPVVVQTPSSSTRAAESPIRNSEAVRAAFLQINPAQMAMDVSAPQTQLHTTLIITFNALFRFAVLSLLDGTHVAGTIGGRVFGVAKNATLHCIKVMNDDGTGATSTIISGINAAAAEAVANGRPSVISMSLGGPPNISIDNAVRILSANY